jgi:carboxyl-terminal processing protease
MTRRNWTWLAGTVLLAGACFVLLAGRPTSATATRDLSSTGFQTLGTVIQLIKYDYVEEPNPARTMDGAFRGLVDSLDVLSTYLNPENAAKLRQVRPGELKETGVVLIKAYGGFPQVVGLIDGSPAAKSGLKAGDFISVIDGRSTLGFSLVETRLALESRGGQPVKVKVLRQARNLELSIDRATLDRAPAAWSPLERTAGVLRLPKLTQAAVDEAVGLLTSNLKESQKPLVLDLRNCYEGDNAQAARLINLFLRADPAGAFLGRQDSRTPLSCSQDPAWEKVPLVVWTNFGTQGPAEIVAAVLQDGKRAKVVGLTTPGLAARTEFVPLQDGSSLLLTTGVFALNSGKKVWGQGVKPDANVEARESGSDVYLRKTLALFPSL